MPDIDFLGHLASESARFRAALQEAAPDARVPSCPDWAADDLLWHLAEVQWFWGTVVRRQVMQTADADALKAERPPDRADVQAFYDRASRDLHDVLSRNPPETPAWTWSTDHTVGFIRRRQAHEALIHRLDAELTAGNRTPMDTALCDDGVDEVLRVMYGGVPEWGTFTPEGDASLRVLATDTGSSWLVTFGRFTGTDPSDGTTYDELDAHPVDNDPGPDVRAASATVTGTAADLDCWLWQRPTLGELERSGDTSVHDQFATIMAPGIN